MRLALPTTAPRFSTAHPCSNAVKLAAVSNGGRFLNMLSGGRTSTVTGAPTAAEDGTLGFGTKFAAPSSSDMCSFTGVDLTNYSNLTLAAICRPAASTSVGIVGSNASGNNGCNLHLAALVLIFTAGAVADVTSSLTLVAGVPYFIVASCSAGASVNFVVVNLVTGQTFTDTKAGPASTNAPTTGYAVGNSFGFTNSFGGNIAAAAYTAQYYTLPQLRLWAAEPWSFWYADGP